MKKNNILITGINGFLGGSLVKYLNSNYPAYNIYGIDKVAGKYKNTVAVDINKYRQLYELLVKIKPRFIYHFAGLTSTNDFSELFYANVQTTYSLLRTVQRINRFSPRIIIPSSAAEYGNYSKDDMPLQESFISNPVSLYGVSKMMQTHLSLMVANEGVDVVFARIFNIIGGCVPVNLSIGKFAYELSLIKEKKKKPVLYTRALNTKRDLLDIKDVCNCLVKIALRGKSRQIYNVCRGKSYFIGDLLEKMIKISGIKKVRVVESKRDRRQSDLQDSYGAKNKLEKIVKPFKPLPVAHSLKSTYLYYLSKIRDQEY